MLDIRNGDGTALPTPQIEQLRGPRPRSGRAAGDLTAAPGFQPGDRIGGRIAHQDVRAGGGPRELLGPPDRRRQERLDRARRKPVDRRVDLAAKRVGEREHGCART